jgi:RNA polymerase sigma-70 factor (ECF subfamily)
MMVGYQAGDPLAFDACYAALAPRLRRALAGWTRDTVRAEDLLQDTFLRIHRARHTYDPALPVLPWAYAIARHAYLTDLRRRSRGRETEVPVEELPAPERERACPFARQGVRAALGQLEHDRREAVVLHHVWGLSFGEIAQRLGITEGAARVRAHRAIMAMRRFLGRPVR